MNNWAILDYVPVRTFTGVRIVIRTDVPCHLWCRMTLEPPLKHKEAIIKRGLITKEDVRFCFVAYEDNEQFEPGDTLVHSFLKPDWPVCETRYFYFIGTIGGAPSPSASTYFEYHRQAVEQWNLFPTSDGDEISIHFETPGSIPHWQACLYYDSTFDPAWGIWGQFFGQFVEERSWPGGNTMYRDLYHFEDTPPIPEPIEKVTIEAVAGRSLYPYGRLQHSIKTYGTVYDGPLEVLASGLHTYTHDFLVNPFTGNPWTHAEVTALQAGIRIGYCASFGHVACDRVCIVLTLGPAP